MRQGSTITPAGLALALALTLLGAAVGRTAPPADVVAVTDERFGQPIAPIFLLARPDVQGDLQLNQRQIAGARDLAGRLVERLLALKTKSGQAAMSEKRDIDETMATWLRRELAPVQLERLDQISLQWEGASALRRPTVVEFLALAQPQRRQIEQRLADRDRRHAAGALPPAELDRINREALAVLTPLQKQQWESLLGPPCRFFIGRPADRAADAGLRGQPRSPGR